MADDGIASPTPAGAGPARSSATHAPPASASAPVPTPSSAATTSAHALNHPPGHGIRRAVTVDEASTSSFRRRPTLSRPSPETSFEGPRRRSSNFSDYSLNEARRSLQDDVLNPRPPDMDGVMLNKHDDAARWSSFPLAFALMPAVAGVLFKNGSSVVTDVMLLALAAIFLHWSVTQPWNWYHSAQEVRIREESAEDAAVVLEYDSESDTRSPTQSPAPSSKLENVPEEATTAPKPAEATSQSKTVPKAPARTDAQRAALRELYWHEMLALLACFTFPALAAYGLHRIRHQLSRPSEGLVSNYNLSIFLLASEIKPLSHLLKLVQARTLHLQRVVHSSPFRNDEIVATGPQLRELTRRLESLEARAPGAPQKSGGDVGVVQARNEADLVREVRSGVQPELDALNRAVRRYEKKLAALAFQTDARLAAIETRLNDAISLAAVAAKNSTSHWTVVEWLIDSVASILMLPVRMAVALAFVPIRLIMSLFQRRQSAEKASPRRGEGRREDRSARPPASQSQPKHGGNRVSSRVTRRW